MREAAKVAQGRKVADNVQALVVPGSKAVKAQAEAEASAEFAKASPYPEPESIFEDVYWEVDNKTEAGQTGRHFFND